MKKFLVFIFAMFFLFSISKAQTEINNNIALLSLGATAEDNGSFSDYGTDQDATLAIDGDSTTYWAGLQSNSPQQMWIYFDKEYNINKIYIDEKDNAYINTGIIEYYDGYTWKQLYSINKTTPDLFFEFSPVKAKGVRITVNTLTAPSSWYNKVACLNSVEVNGIESTSNIIENNIALLSLGATAEDNGSFSDYGTDQDATLAIDGDSTTYWAGLQSNSPQQMWIYFDKEYNINKIYIDEKDNAYINTGIIEYYDGYTWKQLYSINKTTPDLFFEFSPVKAKGVRITVNTLTAPSSWYNKVACLNSVEVNGIEKSLQFTRIMVGNIVNDSSMSNGCTWVDYNNDGWQDLFVLCNDENLLYKNNGDGTFSKMIDDAFLKHDGIIAVGSAWADYDNDGDLDVYFATIKNKANYFYKNNGDGTFERITNGIIGTDTFQSEGGISCGDFNNDGIVDLFVGAYGFSSHLYFADNNGNFNKITGYGIVNDNTLTFGSVAADYDNDGDLDIFISNQNDRNGLYLNNGNGEFEKFVQDNIFSEYNWTTGASWGDYDNDGDFDLFVCNGSGSYNVNNYLYKNNGDGTFTKITEGITVNDGGYSYVPSWIDYDNDGWLDLFVVNRNSTPPFLYHNNGDGTFTKIKKEPFLNNDGLDFDAACWGDYDNDGFLDLFISVWNGEKNRLYHNNGNNNNWLELKLNGKVSNRSGIGAKIRVKATIHGNPVWQLRQIASQASFRSQNDLIAHFGLGDASIIDSLKVEWPSGIVDVYSNIKANQIITAIENQGITPIEHQVTLTIPQEYKLNQNYPNPFNPTTHIGFEIPVQTNVKIEIYNIQGKLVKTLLNKILPAGVHNVDFYANNLASGVYLYRIQAGEFQQVRKMILVK